LYVEPFLSFCKILKRVFTKRTFRIMIKSSLQAVRTESVSTRCHIRIPVNTETKWTFKISKMKWNVWIRWKNSLDFLKNSISGKLRAKFAKRELKL
jgi:hypothetical protein